MSRVWPFVATGVAVAACAAFEAEPVVPAQMPDAGTDGATSPPGPDGGSSDGGETVDASGGGCSRPRFTDDFERPDLNGNWDHVPSVSQSTLMVGIDSTKGSGGQRSLSVIAQTGRATGGSAYLEELVAKAACAIDVQFDLFTTSLPSIDDEFVTFLSIQLDKNASAILLQYRKNGAFLYEQTNGGAQARHTQLPSIPLSKWTTIALHFDPSTSPPHVLLKVGTIPVAYTTELDGLGIPESVRVGAPFATANGAAIFNIDNIAIE